MRNGITYNAAGDAVSFVGPEAVDLFRCAALAASMGLFKAGMRTRGMSGSQALKEATKYTGVTYKRGEYDKARVDLKARVQMAKAVIPSLVHGPDGDYTPIPADHPSQASA